MPPIDFAFPMLTHCRFTMLRTLRRLPLDAAADYADTLRRCAIFYRLPLPPPPLRAMIYAPRLRYCCAVAAAPRALRVLMRLPAALRAADAGTARVRELRRARRYAIIYACAPRARAAICARQATRFATPLCATPRRRYAALCLRCRALCRARFIVMLSDDSAGAICALRRFRCYVDAATRRYDIATPLACSRHHADIDDVVSLLPSSPFFNDDIAAYCFSPYRACHCATRRAHADYYAMMPLPANDDGALFRYAARRRH